MDYRGTPPPTGFAILIAALALALMLIYGCAPAPTKIIRTETVEVLVPVAVPCPAPPEVERPRLPIARLDSSSTPAEVARAYAATTWLLMGYAERLEILLDAYREKEEEEKK